MRFWHTQYKWLTLLLVILLSLVVTGSALAAEFAGDEAVYRLAAGEVVNDDLYASSGEIYIDGTVKGDLYAAGGYIEINGVVEGDLVAAGGGIVIRGQVLDDVRVAGGGIEISGAVGDDLFAAGGGGPGMAFPIQFGARSIAQGIRLADSAQVNGDALIFGGGGRIDGHIAGDLQAAMGSLELAAQVDGDADLQAGNLRVEEGSRVAGVLRYATPEEAAIPGGVTENAQYEASQPEAEEGVSFIASLVGWIVRTALILVGFALLGWLLLRYTPTLLTDPVAAIDDKPLEAGLYGLLAGALFVFIPILSILLVVLVWIFWGSLPALVMGFFLVGGWALIWLFSPLITGLWLGQRIAAQAGREATLTLALLSGVLLIVVVGRIPIVGWLVYLISFALALGGVLRARRRAQDEPDQPAALATT